MLLITNVIIRLLRRSSTSIKTQDKKSNKTQDNKNGLLRKFYFKNLKKCLLTF